MKSTRTQRMPGLLLLLGILFIFLLTACSSAAVSSLKSKAGGVAILVPTNTACPTAEPQAENVPLCSAGILTATPARMPSPTPPEMVGPAAPHSPMPSPALPLPSPTPCPPELCAITGSLFLQRPIAPPGQDSVDVTYRFGSTQGGLRDPHHGVEFLNGYGTPVLAAADGVVVVAGDDRKTFYGPYSYFYGNLVVLKHTLPPALQAMPTIPQPFYTLYGHLSKIEVQVGQKVHAGQEIGQVGMSGVATGSHLHFEVRLGDNTYKNSRNPELWLMPHTDNNGTPNGALAGRILDANGQYLSVSTIVVQHLAGPEQRPDYELYTRTYEEKNLLGQPSWQESFALGDLQPGWYRISFAQNGIQQRTVQILPGQLAVVTFQIGGK